MIRVCLNSPAQMCGAKSCRRRRKGFMVRNLRLAILLACAIYMCMFLSWQPWYREEVVDQQLQRDHLSETREKILETFTKPLGAGVANKSKEQLAIKQMPIDWQKTQLGPGYPAIIDSAWSDLGVLTSGSVLRIEADGFNGQAHPNAAWGWYLNIWSGDGRHWTEHPEASRLLHINPRPRAGIVAMNHCLRGGWGPQKDVSVPTPWRLEHAATPFTLELELGPKAWGMKLNGQWQPSMRYDRQGDLSQPLTLQVYDVLRPRVFLEKRHVPDTGWTDVNVDWQKTQLGPGYPAVIDSAWADLGILNTGSFLRIEAEGFNGQNHPNAAWGWYLNIWSGDGRHWTEHPEASRLLHINPRPRAGIVAMNHCLRGGWGPQKDVSVPAPWRLEHAATPFTLELELGPKAWSVKLNGELQQSMEYNRQGDFSNPLTLQLYDLIKPHVKLSR